MTDRVLLWPDTFNNYLESSVLQAAVEVLEDAGYTVEIPPRPCAAAVPTTPGCSAPAERLWRQTLLDAPALRSERASRWSGSSRAASPCSATS